MLAGHASGLRVQSNLIPGASVYQSSERYPARLATSHVAQPFHRLYFAFEPLRPERCEPSPATHGARHGGSRVPQAAFERDRVEPLANLLGAPDHVHAEGSNDLRLDDRRCREHPHAPLTERLHQRAVFELSQHPRAHAEGFEPLAQPPAHRRPLALEQHRRAVYTRASTSVIATASRSTSAGPAVASGSIAARWRS